MANLTDADKVLRNDTGKSIVSKLDGIKDAIVAQGGGAHSLDQLSDVDIDSQTLAAGQSIVYNDVTEKFENGEVSTVAALDDLTDVSITSAQQGDSLRNDGNGNWVNEPTKIVMTQAEWEAIADKQAWRNAHKNTDLILSDAPNLNATAQDISYDGGADTVWDKVEAKASKTQTATFSPETGVQVMHISTGYTDKQGCISGEIRFTQTANTWKDLGTLSIKPNDICQVCGVHTGTGAFMGIVRLQPTTGKLQVYPIIAVNNDAVGFSISFITA